MELRVRELWPAALALVAATGIVALVEPGSRASRVTNLDLGASGFGDTYILLHRSEPGRCYVSDRRDATMRRSDTNQPGRKWDCERFGGERNPLDSDTWLVQSKLKGKGTIFFVPVYDLVDWSYPLLYEFVRERRTRLELPAVTLTQLFVNRIYEGLYLRVALPFDLRKKDGGSGVLREILSVSNGQLQIVNSRFEPARTLYAEDVAEGRFPALSKPDPALAWLAARCPVPGLSFLLSNREPQELTLLPLPLWLPSLYEARRGRSLSSFEDERYRRWTEEVRRAAPGPGMTPFSENELAALRTEFTAYERSLRDALRADAELHESQALIEKLLPQRRAAIADLDLAPPGASG